MTSSVENLSENENTANEFEQDNKADDEDDYTGYFLEPTADGVNIAERIAEANRKLYEEDESDKENMTRPRKVQFSESLVDFEPENYESGDFIESDDDLTISEEDEEKYESVGEEKDPDVRESEKLLKRFDRPKTANKEPKNEAEEGKEEPLLESTALEEIAEEIQPEQDSNDDVREEIENDPQQMKIVLVMLPREQSSSCESVIGEEVSGEKKAEANATEEKTVIEESNESVVIAETLPKSVRKVRAQAANPCKISKISPDLNYSLKADTKMWHTNRKQGLKCKKVKVRSDCNMKQVKAISKEEQKNVIGERPNTAPEKRSCCMIRTGLPKYNGLRSEYGLSAEQLQERRRRTFELRQQKRVDKIKKKQEEIRKRVETEENFNQWLYNKSRGGCAVVKRTAQVDTLTRSDVYIQNHAVYASQRSISYAVEYGLGKKVYKGTRMLPFDRKQEKSINLERLFDGDSPNVKRTHRIYLGSNNWK